MFRQGLRQCAPLRRTAPSWAGNAGRSHIALVRGPSRRVAVSLPSLRRSFHQNSIFRQDAAAAQHVDAAHKARTEPQRKAFSSLISEGVHPELVRAIVDGMGYAHMSEVQEQTIGSAMKGKDMVAQAKTGTGKTLAFLIPIAQRILAKHPDLANPSKRYTAHPHDVFGLVISPTRELAEQIAVEAKKLCRNTGIQVQVAVGGANKAAMLQNIRRSGCHLLVATPGRLLDLLEDPRSGVDAPNLETLVLDEADRMLDVGFADTLEQIQRLLPNPREKTRQTMLYSATIPRDVVGLAKSMVRPDQFEFVQTIKEDETPTHEKIPQRVSVAQSTSQLWLALYELLDREMAKAREGKGMPFKAIVYFPTTAAVQMASQLDWNLRRNRGETRTAPPVYHIHGKLSQQARTRAATMFRQSPSALLISSDVTARGMDFPNVSHVIQVGPPPSREQYIHRLGRTGRQDKSGEGWLLLVDREVSDTQRELAGLPLTPDQSLTLARTSLDNSHSLVSDLRAAFSGMDRQTLNEAYIVQFAGKMKDMYKVVADVNKWVTDLWGWSEPPVVSQNWVAKRGMLGIPGLNIGVPMYRNNQSFGRSSRSSRGGDGSFESGWGRRDDRAPWAPGSNRRGGSGFGRDRNSGWGS